MKTDNIYIGQLVISTNVSEEGTLFDYFYGQGIRRKVKYHPIKYMIVNKKKNSRGFIAKDLKTKKKYLCELPTEKGVLYVSPSTMMPFELYYPEAQKNLSKKKILKMGNDVINKIIEIENKEKKK